MAMKNVKVNSDVELKDRLVAIRILLKFLCSKVPSPTRWKPVSVVLRYS